MAPTQHPFDLLDELAEIERPAWDAISARIPAWHPRMEGDPDPTPDPDPDPDPDPTPSADDPPGDDADIEAWKAYARRWEDRAKKSPDQRKAKAAEKRAEKAEARVAELEAENATESERAITAARDEAKAEARAEHEAERRADRLEVAVTRLAARGLKIGEGDDAQTVRFADPDDALVNLEAAIKRGEVDGDDIFDDEGKVQTNALTDALADLLDRKPHLRAEAKDTGPAGPSGSADGGKGGGSGKTAEDMSVEDHMRRKGRMTAPKD